MNRTIKFRAKRTDNSEWVYGFYVNRNSKHQIVSDGHMFPFTVIPDTLGQLSGFTDKNEKEIYEGDICSLTTEDSVKINVVCRFGSAHRTMETGWLCDIVGFYFERDHYKSFPIIYNYKGVHDTEIMEVIGNIHDNKDLLTTK
jgi:uncharacterized phage protein (TIGR01671 family)